MIRRHRLRTLALVALMSACSESTTSAPNDFVDGAVNVVDDVSSSAWPSDPLAIESLVISGDQLHATVRYGGGCKRHRIALLFGRVFLESLPVQIDARLSHDGGGDMCEALITRTLTFDLTPIKQRYRNAYGSGAATIVINLAGFSRSLRYTF